MDPKIIIKSAPVVGFSGARILDNVDVRALHAAAEGISPEARVLVGCANGIDREIRNLFPNAEVFKASDFGKGRWAYAARSIACVKTVAEADGLWIAFPDKSCPDGLLPQKSPSKAFSGKGSGTWASLSLTVGLGTRSLVFLPVGVEAPTGWGFSPIGHQKYLFNPAKQLSLFN